MRAMSKRRLKRDAGYQRARFDVFNRADGMCEAMAVHGCTRRCEQVHHIAGRGGPDPHRLDLLLGVCHVCHDHIERHPAEAFERGWRIRRNGVQT